ncbi:MAG: hypothetical protein GX417_07025 [Clostridiales bacterium]|nr:hypothetical protein [Clostridiales bacterium]
MFFSYLPNKDYPYPCGQSFEFHFMGEWRFRQIEKEDIKLFIIVLHDFKSQITLSAKENAPVRPGGFEDLPFLQQL